MQLGVNSAGESKRFPRHDGYAPKFARHGNARMSDDVASAH